MPRAFTRSLSEVAFFFGVAFFVILAAFPFYWMVITAFKTNSDLYDVNNVPFWFNEPPTLEHLTYLFKETLFARWLLNSLIIGVCVTVITLVTAVPAGYSLARMTSRRGEALGDSDFLDLPGAADSAVLAIIADHRRARAAEFDVVAGAGVSHIYNSVLLLAADGFL